MPIDFAVDDEVEETKKRVGSNPYLDSGDNDVGASVSADSSSKRGWSVFLPNYCCFVWKSFPVLLLSLPRPDPPPVRSRPPPTPPSASKGIVTPRRFAPPLQTSSTRRRSEHHFWACFGPG